MLYINQNNIGKIEVDCSGRVEFVAEPTRYGLYNALTNYATHLAKNERQKEKIQMVAQKVLVTKVGGLKRKKWDWRD